MAVPTLVQLDEHLLRVLQQKPDPAAANSRFPTALRRRFLNEFQSWLPTVVEVATLRKYVPVTANADGVIALPSDYLCGAIVWWVGDSNGTGSSLLAVPLRPKSIQNADREWNLSNRENDTANTPELVCAQVNATTGEMELRVFPKFSGIDLADGFRLSYTMRPPTLSADTDTMKWMTVYEPEAILAPVYYAAARLWALDANGSVDMITTAQGLLDQSVERILNTASGLINMEDRGN